MLQKRNYLLMLVAVIIFLLTYSLDLGIPPGAQTVLAIMLFSGFMWVTEALPLHVTGLLTAFLLATVGRFSANEVFSPFFDPIIMLLLGGFVLAVGMQKHELDRLMAMRFLKKIGTNPKIVLIGMMIITAFLSLWITNTAATLIMIPIALSILRYNKLSAMKSNYGKAVVLGIPFAATLGGVGTIIGSTPNAMAVKFLADEGITVSFLDWMLFGLPLVILVLPVIWLVLIHVFRPEIKEVKMKLGNAHKKMNVEQKKVLVIFVFTVFMWLTTAWHGISTSVVAIIPVALLYLLGLLNGDDFSRISWSALILFGSGLSLGLAIHSTGLDLIIANAMKDLVIGQPAVVVMIVVAIIGILFTAVASNTAAAAIFIPVVMPFAVTFGIDIRILTVLAAMAVSLDFMVPIGTPPSTIAYSTGYIKIIDMFKTGVIISVIACLILVGLFLFW